MATKIVSGGYPLNSLNEIVMQAGVGTTTVVGQGNPDQVAIDETTGRMVVVGIAGSGSSVPAPAAITSSRNLASADNGGTLYNATTNAYTLTVPSGLPAGFGVAVVQSSTGVVTIAAGAGVTINNISSFTKTGGQYAVISLINTAANTYILAGSGAI